MNNSLTLSFGQQIDKSRRASRGSLLLTRSATHEAMTLSTSLRQASSPLAKQLPEHLALHLGSPKGHEFALEGALTND